MSIYTLLPLLIYYAAYDNAIKKSKTISRKLPPLKKSRNQNFALNLFSPLPHFRIKTLIFRYFNTHMQIFSEVQKLQFKIQFFFTNLLLF